MICVFLLDLTHSFLRTCQRNSQRFEKPPLPRVSGIQNAIKSKLHDVLYCHPDQIITPNKTDDFPGKRRHEPALTTHQHRSDLSRNNCKEKLRARIGRLPQEPTGASYEQHQVPASDEL